MAPRAQCPVGGFQDWVYDETGLFQSGYIVDASNGWRGATNNYDPTLGTGGSPYVPIGGSQYSLARRQVSDEITNEDYSINLRSELTDQLTLTMDAQYATSKKENLDFSVFGSSFADSELDITGDLPVVTPHKPQFLGYTWSAPSPELGGATDQEYFSDPRFQFWRAAMDHAELSTGDQFALKADLDYEFGEDSFIRRAKVGARFQGRDQEVRYTTYNWGMLSEVWTGSRPINFDDTDPSQSTRYEFPNFFRGEVPGPPGAFYYSGDLIDDYDGSVAFFREVQALTQQAGGSPTWNPLAARAGALPDGYLPTEVQTIDQDDYAVYGMLSFGSDDLFGDVRFSGNIGLRYVNTSVVSRGARGPGSQGALNIADPFSVRCAERARPPELGGGTVRPGGICTIGQAAYEELQDFVDGSFVPTQVSNNYDFLLPSLNLKFGLTDDLILRFAASKVITPPDNALIRNYFTPSLQPNGTFTGSAGNPLLVPASAKQFDISLEWYFAQVGSLTLNGFYKDISNFFYQDTRTTTLTNASGITRTINDVRTPANFDGSGKVKGFEIAYQQTFDFLPSPLDGFGVQANYTYIDSEGLPNSFLNTGEPVTPSTVPPGNLPLEQLSKHNYNIAGFYEKGPISLRAAYNWRSRFLLTPADVIFPYYSIFNEPTGQLDASVFINVGDNIRVGVQGVNLLNEVTKTTQAYTGDPDLLAPRSYFMNDRRFSFIIRGNF